MGRFVLANGIEVAYALDGRPNAPTILLGNGLGSDYSAWDSQIDALGGDFKIIRYNMRGHGGTATTPGDYSLELLAADALALLDAFDIEKAHFAGFSLGGMVGQLLGVIAPDRFSSLTFCATTSDSLPHVWGPRVTDMRRDGVEPVADATVERWFSPGFRARNPELMARLRAMVLRTTREGYAGCAAAIRDMGIASIIQHITLPTLVIAGEDDGPTPPDHQQRIADRINGSRLVVLKDSGHMPMLDQPEAFNRAFKTFLLEVERSERSHSPAQYRRADA